MTEILNWRWFRVTVLMSTVVILFRLRRHDSRVIMGLPNSPFQILISTRIIRRSELSDGWDLPDRPEPHARSRNRRLEAAFDANGSYLISTNRDGLFPGLYDTDVVW